jgi:DNA-binding beta-propeller fold protein YncE
MPKHEIPVAALAVLAGVTFLLLLSSSLVPALARSGTGSAPSTHARESAELERPTAPPATHARPVDTAAVTPHGGGQVLVATIPVGLGPELPAYDSVNGWIYVSNGGNGSDNVSVINGTSVQASIALGNATPLPPIIDTSNGYAYVAVNYTAQVNGTPVYTGAGLAVLNGTSILATISLGTGNLSVGGAFDSWNRCIYETVLSETNGSYSIAVINGTSVVGSLAAQQGAGQPIFDPVNGWLYVPNFYTGTVTVLNGTFANSTSVIGSVMVGGGFGQCGCGDPVTAAVNLTDGYVYVVDQEDGFNTANVAVLNGSTVVTTINLEVDFDGYCPTAAYWDPVNGDVYVLTSSGCSGYYQPGVNVIADLSLVGSQAYWPQAAHRLTATVDPRTGYLYVGAVGGEYLSAMRNVSRVGNVTLSGVPGPGVFDPTNSLLYVPTSSSIISVLNASYVYPANPYPRISSFTAQPSTLEVGSPLLSTTNLTVNATGGIGPLTYDYPLLPAGCASQNVSVLDCTPTSPGLLPFYELPVEATVTDTVGSTASWTFNITILPRISANASVSQATVDVGETDYFSVTYAGGSGSVTLAWEFGDGNGATGMIVSHTYSVPGIYTAQVWANDSAGASSSTSLTVSVALALTAALAVSNATPSLGQSIEINATASGGRGLFSYSYVGLPPGCVGVNASSIGCLPTQAGFYNLTVNINDVNGGVASATIPLRVVFGFTVGAPTSDVVGQPFSIYVEVAQSAGDVHYTYSSLPAGCSSEDVSVLTCTPTSVGNYSISVKVVSSLYGAAQRIVDLSVVGSGTTGVPGQPQQSMVGQGDVLLDEVVIGAAIGAVVIAAVAVLLHYRKKTR